MAVLAVAAVVALASAQEVRIEVGDDPHEVVFSAPAGSTFVFASGVHRLSDRILPRHGDVFRGEDGAVLNGAVLLDDADFSRQDGLWAVEVEPSAAVASGECRPERPRCGFPNDLYLDDRPLRHVSQKEFVRPGFWYLDFETGTAYMADDPREGTVEFSMARGAIMGGANNVTVENLVIEKFANRAQRGAVHAYGPGEPPVPGVGADDDPVPGHSWVIRGNTIRLNHGVGVVASHAPRIVDNRILDNGQLGVLSVEGADAWIEGNEIAGNNYAGYRMHWEAGGAKFIKTRRLTVRGNHVHGNDGAGLWADMDNIDTVYAENTIERNATTGIFHETSYEAVIRDNVIRENGTEVGTREYAYVFGSGILVYNSRDVEVTGNLVVANWNGINGLHHDRGDGAYGPYELRNLLVHDNVIHLGYHAEGVGPGDAGDRGRGIQGVSGVSQAGGFEEIYSRAYDNRFVNNHYLVEDPTVNHWTWDDRRVTFSSWTHCAYAYQYWPNCTQDEGSVFETVANTEEALRRASEAIE